MEWRKKRDGEWWLVFTDAPAALGEPDANGVLWPPSMVFVRAEGCGHLYSYYNGAMPGDASDEDVDYIHICDLGELMAILMDLRMAVGV